VLLEALHGSSIRLVALIDNRSLSSPIPPVPVLFGEAGLDGLVKQYERPEELLFAVAVGGSKGRDRLSLVELLEGRGLSPLTIVHRTAFVAADATIGASCQVLAMAAVCSCARIEAATIVNTGASVDHDCRIGRGSHIGPGAHLAGEVLVGERVFVGTGAVVLPRITIGNDSIVGGGAVVVDDIPPNTTVVGNPARPIRRKH
jgi:sugar O-acyltransferase (sialic acid O-acetyltransferase NeuD family)